MTNTELYNIAKKFDFKTLEFTYVGLCPVFIKRNGIIEAWVPGTDVDTALKQNDIFYLGMLSEEQAKDGYVPENIDEVAFNLVY